MELIERITFDGPRMVVRAAPRLSAFVPNDFDATYPADVDLAALPPQVSLLPFIWNVAPIVWAVGANCQVDVLDRRVAESLEAIRAQLRRRYPGLKWHGSLTARSLVETQAPPSGRFDRAALFSGGVDSISTALRYTGSELLLVTVWGADTRVDREQEWRGLEAAMRSFAGDHAGELAVVRSNFRALRVARLNALISELRFWYLQVQHSMALAGLAAPLLYRHGTPLLYVPATASPIYDAHVTTGSVPAIDNRISLATARVLEDGYELTRQQKLVGIVEHFRNAGNPPPTLRVCWEPPTAEGGNCGRCEKCLRTMAGLVVAGADPVQYGFPAYDPAVLDEVPAVYAERQFDLDFWYWADIQDHARSAGRGGTPFLDWLRTFDFRPPAEQADDPRTAVRRRYNRLALRAPRLYGWLRRAKRSLLGAHARR